jgi:acyl-CoA hydrolase
LLHVKDLDFAVPVDYPIPEHARALIEIAHPNSREALERDAFARFQALPDA